jgi:hypothetical protein
MPITRPELRQAQPFRPFIKVLFGSFPKFISSSRKNFFDRTRRRIHLDVGHFLHFFLPCLIFWVPQSAAPCLGEDRFAYWTRFSYCHRNVEYGRAIAISKRHCGGEASLGCTARIQREEYCTYIEASIRYRAKLKTISVKSNWKQLYMFLHQQSNSSQFFSHVWLQVLIVLKTCLIMLLLLNICRCLFSQGDKKERKKSLEQKRNRTGRIVAWRTRNAKHMHVQAAAYSQLPSCREQQY